LIDTLKRFPGKDEVNLCVVNDDRVFKLRLSNISINYCPELHQRLVELAGEDGVKLETRAG